MDDSQRIHEQFIKITLFSRLQQLQEASLPLWGKMNARQMVEHLTDFFDVSTTKLSFPLETDPELLPKYKAFLYSDKAFRENTKAPASVVPEIPAKEKRESLAEAIGLLQQAVNDFFGWFAADVNRESQHPVFGYLNYQEWLMLHYKHVQHHLKQFDLR